MTISNLVCRISQISFAILLLASQASGQEYTNLQVLDPNISRDELGQVMLQNLQGLGLPRRQREGCLYCHVGGMDLPVQEWDFASDEKETKDKAREMMRMVQDINERHLAKIENRLDPSISSYLRDLPQRPRRPQNAAHDHATGICGKRH